MKSWGKGICSSVLTLSLVFTPLIGNMEYNPIYAEENESSNSTVPGELIVKYKNTDEGEAQIEEALANDSQSIETIQADSENLVAKVELVNEQDVSEKIKELESLPTVEYAVPNYQYTVIDIPKDTYSSDQWGIQATEMMAAWQQVPQDKKDDVIIAILDTGVDTDHEDLAANLLPGANFVTPGTAPEDDNGHGTHVAGIAAAIANNEKGITGAAGGVKILPVKVLNNEGSGSIAQLIEGINYAVAQGADVINLSLGRKAVKIDAYGNVKSTHNQAEYEAIQYAINNNVVVVAATGNDSEHWSNPSVITQVGYPAAYNNVIAVGAVDWSEQTDFIIADFSNVGAQVDVVAPGVHIVGPYLNNKYATSSGTSQATPFVAGLAVLLKAQNPEMTPAQIETIIKSNAMDLGDSGTDDYFGSGLINGKNVFDQKPAVPSLAVTGEEQSQTITMTTQDAETAIYFTIDGSEPTMRSTRYEGAIPVIESTMYKAISVKNGMVSDVSTLYIQSNNNRLASLTIAEAIEPVTNVENIYKAKVKQETTALTLIPVLEDNKAKITVNSADYSSGQTIPTDISNVTQLLITVSAENGASNVYTLEIEKIAPDKGESTGESANTGGGSSTGGETSTPSGGRSSGGGVSQTPSSGGGSVGGGAPAPSPAPAPAPVPAGGGAAPAAPSNADIKEIKGSTNEKTLQMVISKSRVEQELKSTKKEIEIDATSEITYSNLDLSIPGELFSTKSNKNKNIVIKGNEVSFEIVPGSLTVTDTSKAVQLKTEVSTLKVGSEMMAVKMEDAKAASNVFDFSASTETKEISHFKKPIKITIDYDPRKVSNSKKLGVYYFNKATKKWEYVGGTVNGSTISFETNHFSSYAVMEYNKTFKDIITHWAKEDIELMAAKHIAVGVSNNQFAPNASITRAEFTALIMRALNVKAAAGGNIFTDVKPNDWFAADVAKAYQNGIISGVTPNTFNPRANVTREQMATMIMNAYAYKTGKKLNSMIIDTEALFSDSKAISTWATRNVRLANQVGLINGNANGTFAPKDNATRAQAISIIKRLIEKE